MIADLVKCKFCGSPVSRRRLQRHIGKLHQAAKSPPMKPPVPEYLISRAMELLEKSPKAGLEFLQKLEQDFRPDTDIYYNTGVVLLHLNRLDEATRYFEKTLQLDKGHTFARSYLTMTLNARRLLSKECTEKDLDGMGSVAHTAAKSGMFQLAMRMGEKMLSVDKEKVGSLNDIGLIYQHQNMYEKAVKYYDEALEIRPDMFEATSNKALCLLVMGRMDEAYSLYSRSVKLKPSFLQGWYHLGVISIKKERNEDALKFLDKATELNDEYYLAWFAKYETLRKLKRKDEAKRCIDRAIELNPEYVAGILLSPNLKEPLIHTTYMSPKVKETSPN